MADLSKTPDSALVIAARAGDEAAFAELYRRHHPGVLKAVSAILASHAQAEEIVQDSFSSAFAALKRRAPVVVFKPWIHAIAHNEAITVWRRERLVNEVSLEGEGGLNPGDERRLVSALSDPERAFAARQRLEHLWDAFAGLPASQARVLAMRELEGMSYREIAAALETTRANVHRTLARARRRLEDDYGELASGLRCRSVELALGRLAKGSAVKSDRRLAARHVRRCTACRRAAVVAGVDLHGLLRSPLGVVLPLPAILRRGQRPVASEKQGWAHLTAGQAESAGSLAKLVAAVASATVVAGLGGPVEPAGVERDRGSDPQPPPARDLAHAERVEPRGGSRPSTSPVARPLPAAPLPSPPARPLRAPAPAAAPPPQRPVAELGPRPGTPVGRPIAPQEAAAPEPAHAGPPPRPGALPRTESGAQAPAARVPSAPMPDEPPLIVPPSVDVEPYVAPREPAGPPLPEPCEAPVFEHNPRPPRTPTVCGDELEYPTLRTGGPALVPF